MRLRRLLTIVLTLFIVPASIIGQLSKDATLDEKQRQAKRPDKPACVRHDPVGFFTVPEILGELAQVYANCYPQPTCTNPTDLETIQIDGYINSSAWLWMGPSSTSFTVAYLFTAFPALKAYPQP